ncbi:MAG: hypothetical protein JSS86_02390 [Cyanobacteria bacterium SZAS LIN-2]|nr:hypothetical protein [Cyanobacteria bacterium SZAS LIN-3]MBS1995124.1 hypothetical protein [Cyanobacteria bacterium SZAS LIN-2]MBS2010526.1 hypothetical protein [Cyanobacteria bacterium SZAS TMP-1]
MTDPSQPTGPDDLVDDSLQIAVLGHLLRNERGQTAATLDTLASLLQAAIPERVEVTLGGYFWNKVRPVDRLVVSLDDGNFDIRRSKLGAPTATHRKVVRGITLKSSEVSMEECITMIVARLTEIEKKSAATRIALNNFVRGK